MDLKEIKRLINLVEEAKITHFAIESDGTKIEIKKDFNSAIPQGQTVILPQTNLQPTTIAEAAPQVTETLKTEEIKKERDPNLIAITSQMVGTCYLTPNPESPPYVKAGDRISNGDVVCLIEAMKLFNEIKSECSGVLEKICIDTGSPVEYGQELFLIRKE